MMENQTNARWIAIVGGVVLLSTCAACLLLSLLLTNAYGGETIRFRNPFASPTQVASSSGGGGTSSDSGGNTSGSNSSGSTATNNGGGNTGSTSGGAASGGSSAAASSDASAYMPRLSGYTSPDVSSISGALEFVMNTSEFTSQSAEGEFSAQSLSGIATTVLVSRLDEFIQCYQRTGAVDGQIYIQANVASMLEGNVPPMGAIVVANQDRLRESLIGCAVSPNDPDSFSAQAANQPCGNYGSFTANDDTFTYVYAGTTSDFCTAAETHFSGFGG